jgi:hypothetical protein
MQQESVAFDPAKHYDGLSVKRNKLAILWNKYVQNNLVHKTIVLITYPEGPATGHLDTGFSWFSCVYKRMLRWFPKFPSRYYMLLMQHSPLKFPSYLSYILRVK